MELTDDVLEEFGGRRSVRGNLDVEQSLVALYEQTWIHQDTSVFVRQPLTRNHRPIRSYIQLSEQITTLECKVGTEIASVLKDMFLCSAVLIRDEYEFMLQTIWKVLRETDDGRAFGYTQTRYPRGSFPPYNPFSTFTAKDVLARKIPGIIITGTPGIGKSMFLLFVLALRLLARKTTVFHYIKDQYLIFHSGGVHRTTVFPERLVSMLPLDAWFLVDSNEQVVRPPEVFHTKCRTSARLMLMAASPRKERLTYSKDLTIEKLFMKTFDLSELIAGRELQIGDKRQKEEALEKFYEEYGSIAREAYNFAHDIPAYGEVIEKELQSITLRQLHDGVHQSTVGFFDNGLTHKVLHVIPLGDAQNFTLSIPTQRLANLVMKNLLQRTEREAKKITGLYLLNKKTRGVASVLMESLALMKLPKGGQWDMTLLQKSRNRAKAPKNAYWRFGQGDEEYTLRIGADSSNRLVEILRGNLATLPISHFSEICKYDFILGKNLKLSTGFFIPKAKNQPTFDAYAYDKDSNHFIIFQVTCAAEHDLNPRGFVELGIQSADVVLVTSYDGGTQLKAGLDVAAKVKNVYRLVLITQENVQN